ncbi:MAG: hypothetical protein ACRD0C_05635 [Acidimicrobiia bacterium]
MSRAGTTTKAVALGALLVLATAGPAAAHAEFEGATVPADSDVELALHVPGERPDAHNAEVVVELPAEFELHSCDVAPGWSCTAEPAVGDMPARVTFRAQDSSAEGGGGHAHAATVPVHGEPAPPPDQGAQPSPPPNAGEADMFHFTVHSASEAGDYSFPVEQHYSDGKTMHWNGDAGSKEPAPVVTVEAPAA